MTHVFDPRPHASRPRRSAVLGACAFLGTHLVEVLTQAGHEVVTFDASNRVAGGLPDAFPEVLRGLGAAPEPWPLDWGGALTGVHFLFVVEGPRVQVEAALAKVDLSSFERAVLISGAEVYGEPGQEPFSEESAAAPSGGRARELLELEASLRSSELPHVVLRPTGTYGPRGLRGLREARQRVGLSWSGEARLGLVHARDVARAALHLAARAESAQATTYNLGDSVGLRQADAARLVTRLVGRPHLSLPWSRLPARWARLLRRRRSPDQAPAISWGAPRVASGRLAQTGFALEFPHPAAGLRETLAWFKQEGWL